MAIDDNHTVIFGMRPRQHQQTERKTSKIWPPNLPPESLWEIWLSDFT